MIEGSFIRALVRPAGHLQTPPPCDVTCPMHASIRLLIGLPIRPGGPAAAARDELPDAVWPTFLRSSLASTRALERFRNEVRRLARPPYVILHPKP
jgi:hypothetical protein